MIDLRYGRLQGSSSVKPSYGIIHRSNSMSSSYKDQRLSKCDFTYELIAYDWGVIPAANSINPVN